LCAVKINVVMLSELLNVFKREHGPRNPHLLEKSLSSWSAPILLCHLCDKFYAGLSASRRIIRSHKHSKKRGWVSVKRTVVLSQRS
jgi:hypothetical protein